MNDDAESPEESTLPSDEVESDKEIPHQEVKEVVMHDFNFTAYNEDIAILGSKGSGKSYLANELLQNSSKFSLTFSVTAPANKTSRSRKL